MTLTPEERAERVVRAIQATVAGDAASVSELYTEAVVVWSPTVSISSRVELAVELEDHEEAFSEVDVVAGPIISARDHVCAEWVATATHSAPLHLDGGCSATPTDRRVTLRGVTVADFDGDRICGARHYWDEIELLAELGLIPGT